jgi:hypothetical protein
MYDITMTIILNLSRSLKVTWYKKYVHIPSTTFIFGDAYFKQLGNKDIINDSPNVQFLPNFYATWKKLEPVIS